MEYYARHKLSIDMDEDELIEELIEELRNNCEAARFAIDDNGDSEESCDWSGHEKDMRLFSSKHPVAIFTLKGEGEEGGDMWIEYYKAGLMQRSSARITFDDFDLSKMS